MIANRILGHFGRNLVADLALAVSSSGTAYAAATLAPNSVTTREVKNHSLLAVDFKAGQLKPGPRGPIGPAGPAGPAGPPGAAGSSDAYTRAQADARFLGKTAKAADADKLDGIESTTFGQLLFASVRDTGELFGSRGATTSVRNSTGRYTVTFNRSLSGCIAIASQHYRTGSGGISAGISGASTVSVITTAGTTETDRDFHVVVLC